MRNKQYKFAETIVEIRTPLEYKDRLPFTDFECEGLKPNYIATFEVVDALPTMDGRIISKDKNRYIMHKDNKTYIYYWDVDFDCYYACRTSEDGKPSCTVLINKSHEKRIWTRLVFDLIELEEIWAENNTVMFHSSYLDLNGEALLFTGPCGMGKSTQADLWAKFRNVEILNGDKSLLYEKNGEFLVSGLPYSGSSHYCVNKSMPIKAIVKLSQAPYNKAEKLTGINAFLNVYKGCYPVSYSPKLIEKQMNLIEKLAADTNVYHFECLPDESAVTYLERFINAK